MPIILISGRYRNTISESTACADAMIIPASDDDDPSIVWELKPRTMAALRRIGITRISQLDYLGELGLAQMPGIGKVVLDDIYDCFRRDGREFPCGKLLPMPWYRFCV